MMTCCVHGTRPVGRPLMKWGHAVHRALRARKISTEFHVWSALAQDVVTWTSSIQPRMVKDKEKRYFRPIFKKRVHRRGKQKASCLSPTVPPPPPPQAYYPPPPDII